MIDLETWLAPYRAYFDLNAFLEAVAPEGSGEPEDENLEGYFRGLLAPLREIDLSTRVWTKFFLTEKRLDEVSSSPEGAREFILDRIRRAGMLSAADASTLAEVCFRLGAVRSSEIATAVAYFAGDRSAVTLTLLAGLGVREGRLAEADAALQEAEKLYPEDPEVAFCRAIVDLASGRSAEAVDDLLELVAREPERCAPWRLLVGALNESGRHVEAIRWGEEAVARHGDDVVLRERLAHSYAGAGRPRDALNALDSAVRCSEQLVGPERSARARLLLWLADLRGSLGSPEEALRIYRSLLSEGETGAAVYAGAASSLILLGRADLADALLDQGLEANPEDPSLLTAIGELRFRSGRDEDAFSALQRAADLEPSRTGNLLLMAAICLRRRQFADASELAGFVARSDPQRTREALVLLGDAHRFSGSLEPARIAYEAARELDPTSEDVLERLRKLDGSSNAN